MTQVASQDGSSSWGHCMAWCLHLVCWILDNWFRVGLLVGVFASLHSSGRVLDFGHLGVGCWILDIGGAGFWTMVVASVLCASSLL